MPVFNGDSMTRSSDKLHLAGSHHLTAISAKPPGKPAFGAGPVDMRPVKMIASHDDVSA
jgi:hypothetical protein